MGPATRLNKYFLPGEGIRREVITADICRYLGNDALVKPGLYEARDGFWVTAYRALTSDMISDLKADSRRWADEQAQAQADPRISSKVGYQDSRTHTFRQRHGPSAQPQDPMGDVPGPMDPRGPPPQQYYDQYSHTGGQGYPGQPGQYQGYSAQQDYPQGPNPDYATYGARPGPEYQAYDPGANYQPRTVPQYPYAPGAPQDGYNQPIADPQANYQPQHPMPRTGGQSSQQHPPRGDYPRGGGGRI
ncbi:MAG: hypothetical protein M1815_003876 [Lichina confinis]|nr:MAG: hypothetical protein M1815_003876 [Lichina confinis]